MEDDKMDGSADAAMPADAMLGKEYLSGLGSAHVSSPKMFEMMAKEEAAMEARNRELMAARAKHGSAPFPHPRPPQVNIPPEIAAQILAATQRRPPASSLSMDGFRPLAFGLLPSGSRFMVALDGNEPMTTDDVDNIITMLKAQQKLMPKAPAPAGA